MNLAGCGRVFWGCGGFRKAPTVNRELDYMLVGRGAPAVSRGWLTGVRRDIFSACEIERRSVRRDTFSACEIERRSVRLDTFSACEIERRPRGASRVNPLLRLFRASIACAGRARPPCFYYAISWWAPGRSRANPPGMIGPKQMWSGFTREAPRGRRSISQALNVSRRTLRRSTSPAPQILWRTPVSPDAGSRHASAPHAPTTTPLVTNATLPTPQAVLHWVFQAYPDPGASDEPAPVR